MLPTAPKAVLIVHRESTPGLTVIAVDEIGGENTDVRVAVWQALANDAFAKGKSIDEVIDVLTQVTGGRVSNIGYTESEGGVTTEVVFHVTINQ
jgi:hypothetical protein